MRAGLRELCWCLLLISSAGCFTSRWGMDHADYREKYDDPYPDKPLRKWGRMAKQMLDARHVAHDGGTYIGAAASNFRGNKAGGAEFGVTNYGSPWLSSKLALAGQFNSGAENAFVGLNAAVNASTPTRVAPFVGAGVFGGVDLASVLTSSGDEETEAQFLGAIYPEAGVHVWLNGRTRLSASASYWVTTVGREHDFWYYGVGLTFGLGPEPRHSAEGELVREDEYVQRLLDERVRTATVTAEDLGETAESNVVLHLRLGSVPAAGGRAPRTTPTRKADRSPAQQPRTPASVLQKKR